MLLFSYGHTSRKSSKSLQEEVGFYVMESGKHATPAPAILHQ